MYQANISSITLETLLLSGPLDGEAYAIAQSEPGVELAYRMMSGGKR